jgi:hypothetical protein
MMLSAYLVILFIESEELALKVHVKYESQKARRG